MSWRRIHSAIVASVLVGDALAIGVTLPAPVLGQSGVAKPPAGSNKPIRAVQFEQLHQLIKPQPGEWQFAQVSWVPTIAEARQKAAKEGKPIFIWYMVGEPLGQC
jgi:hypothetical protein